MKLYQPSIMLKAIALLILSLIPLPVKGEEAFVKSIKVETRDGITISMWVEQKLIRLGQAIIIKYKVENSSNTPIYLVHKASFDTRIEQDTLSISVPVPPPDAHGGYDYTFTKIDINKSYQDQLMIPKDQYMRDKLYEILPLHIEMGFAYVKEIKGLDRRLNIGEDPIALRGLLFDRAIIILLKGISIEVKE